MTSPASGNPATGVATPAFAGLLLVYLVVAANATVANIALPGIASDIGADTADLAWIVNATPLAAAAVLLFGGGAADRFGRRTMLLLGIGTFVVAAVLSVLVHSPGQLVALRALSGIASGIAMPAALALVFMVVKPVGRPTAVGLMGSTQAIGSMIGPLLAGTALLWFAWPAAFISMVPFLLLALVMLVFTLPGDRGSGGGSAAADRPPLDVVGGLLAAVVGGAAVFGLIELADDDGPSWVVALVLAALALATLVWWERRLADGLLDLAVMRQRGWYVPSIALVAVNAILGALLFLATQYVQLVLGLNPLGAALVLLPTLAVWAAAAGLSGVAVRRLGTRRVLAASFVVGAAGLAVAALAAGRESLPLMVVGFALLGLIGMAPAQLTNLTVSTFPAPRRGAGSGLNGLLTRFGLALGVAAAATGAALLYTREISDDLGALRDDNAAQALEGLTGALGLAQTLPDTAAAALAEAARGSFVVGYQAALVTAALVAIAAAALIALALPAGGGRARTSGTETDTGRSDGHTATEEPA